MLGSAICQIADATGFRKGYAKATLATHRSSLSDAAGPLPVLLDMTKDGSVSV